MRSVQPKLFSRARLLAAVFFSGGRARGLSSRRVFLRLLLVLAATASNGCRPDRPAVPASAVGERVVSLAPSLTEIICAVGAADQLVGRTSVCDYPPEAVSNTAVIGDFGAPSLEALLAVKPTLVLHVDLADETLAGKLDNLGIRHQRIPCSRLDEVPAAIETVGRLLHHEERAAALAAALRNGISARRSALPPPEQRPVVLAIIWHDPLTAAGSRSFIADLVSLAGGRNLGDAVARDYFPVSAEWVLANDPEVILCFFMAGRISVRQLVMRQAGWERTRAVRNRRVYDGFDNNVMLRPGPRILEAADALHACIANSP